MKNLSQAHKNKVARLQKDMRSFYTTKVQVRIFHGNTNSTRSSKSPSGQYADVSDFNQILEINLQEKYAVVEANVQLDTLLTATLKHGLMPLVVSEFPGITVGGAVQGGAGESSSFRYGCLHNTCLEYELVTAQGEVVEASQQNNADLFSAAPCSYGSIAILTAIKLRLMPTTSKLKVEYRRVASSAEALYLIEQQVKTTVEFIDAIMFSPTLGVVVTGNFTDGTYLPQKTFHKVTDEWFYIHAQQIVNMYATYHEAIPIRDYLFRYDRGAFWVGKYGYQLYHVPFNRFTRLWFASLMKTRTLYRYLHGASLSQELIIQDICLPYSSTLPFLQYLDKNVHIYPLWLCPLTVDSQHSLSPTNLQTELVMNVGLWGPFKKGYERFVAVNRDIEQAITQLGGRKVLYAHTYYAEQEFWQNYNKQAYDDIRSKYKASVTFPDIFSKVAVTKQIKRSLLRGWWALLRPRC